MDETTNELTPQECWALLGTTDLGRLAVCLGEAAEIFPVNYAVAHGTVVFRTGAGLKHVSARLNRLLTFEADGVDHDAGIAWSVVVKGRGHDMVEGPEAELARTLTLHPAHGGPKPLFVRIEPDVVTGRRFRVAPVERWVDDDGQARVISSSAALRYSADDPCMTSTGQAACSATTALTEPSRSPANPPCPRLPTTSMAAPRLRSIRTWAALPLTTTMDRSAGRWGPKTS
jgi:hypothetical protein